MDGYALACWARAGAPSVCAPALPRSAVKRCASIYGKGQNVDIRVLDLKGYEWLWGGLVHADLQGFYQTASE
jgi:hypothetical protein